MEAVAPPTEMIARKLSFSDSEDARMSLTTMCPPERLRVYVRVRPNTGNQEAGDLTVTDDSVSLRTTKSHAQGRPDTVEETSYSFDRVFDAQTTQAQVFEGAMLPQVCSLFSGRDTLTFAYGITNAGKTYTIQGNDTGDGMGVLPRSLQLIFEALAAQRERLAAAAADEAAPMPRSGFASQLNLDDSCQYEVRASFLEVYGNDTFDLLAASDAKAKDAHGAPKRSALRLKEDNGKVFVEGLREVELHDYDEAVTAVKLGWQQRATNSNGLNDVSSRSHAVLSIKLLTHKPGADAPTATRLCVVDLAGAERQKKTQANGARLHEAKSINQDLMVLGHCLRDLRWNQSHSKATQKVAPFRDARITMLFRDYLSGNGQISVIAAVSPCAADVTGTLDTLRFAAIAQQVKVVEQPKPAPAKPSAPLPRVAMGLSAAVLSGRKPAAADAADDVPADASEVSALRELNAALQERLLAAQIDRIGLERTIRSEVSAEMSAHIERVEAEMKERLEIERYNTEDMYLKKLALVRGTTEKRVDAASVQAHTDMLQHTRDMERREAEHAEKVRRLEEVLEKTKAQAEASNTGVPAEALAAAEAAAAAASTEAEAERAEREQAESARAEAEERAAELTGQVNELRAELGAVRDENAALTEQVEELEGRVAHVVEITRQSRTLSNSVTKTASSAVKAARSAGKAMLNVSMTSNEGSSTREEEGMDSPRRSLGELTNSIAVEAPPADDVAPVKKASKLKQLKMAVPGASIFSKKAKAEAVPTADEFHDFAPQFTAPQYTSSAVEPTPIARRTRGASRGAR